MDSGAVTVLLQAIDRGDPAAAEDLLPLVYGELRKLAQHRLDRLPAGQTLQATALVHEAYLRLVGDDDPGWNGRGHFFGAAARAMRNILVDRARRRAAARHGGDRRFVSSERAPESEIAWTPDPDTGDMLALDEALGRLEAHDPRKCQVVMLRYFAGLPDAQIARVLGVTTRTVERDWRFARSWLQTELDRAP